MESLTVATNGVHWNTGPYKTALESLRRTICNGGRVFIGRMMRFVDSSDGTREEQDRLSGVSALFEVADVQDSDVWRVLSAPREVVQEFKETVVELDGSALGDELDPGQERPGLSVDGAFVGEGRDFAHSYFRITWKVTTVELRESDRRDFSVGDWAVFVQDYEGAGWRVRAIAGGVTRAALRLRFEVSGDSRVVDSPTSEALARWIGRGAPLRTRLAGLCSWDVGQAMMSSLHDVDGMAVAYLDFGGESNGANADRMCSCRSPLILISHWHQDHWRAGAGQGGGRRFLPLRWIGPYQDKAAPGVAQHLDAVSAAGGSVRLIGELKNSIKIAIGDGELVLQRANGPKSDLNNSGLVVEARVRGWRGLLPGDASYSRIPHVRDRYDLIVVPHHGSDTSVKSTSRFPASVPQPSSDDSVLIYSYGFGNSYGHPGVRAISEHVAKSWQHTGFGVGGPASPPFAGPGGHARSLAGASPTSGSSIVRSFDANKSRGLARSVQHHLLACRKGSREKLSF